MSASNFKELAAHVNHDIECVFYGLYSAHPVNVSVECFTCGEVLLDFDNDQVVE